MSANVLQLKQHDTGPAFRAQLLNNTTPVSLTGATARLIMRLQSGTTTVTGAMALEDQTSQPGWVRRSWQAGDTAVIGYYQAEVEVTWGDGTVQTFPADGYAGVNIVGDLG